VRNVTQRLTTQQVWIARLLHASCRDGGDSSEARVAPESGRVADLPADSPFKFVTRSLAGSASDRTGSPRSLRRALAETLEGAKARGR